jgi:sterol-4alpha-carboxylate 3-dehydrogenase (decarboxylating)
MDQSARQETFEECNIAGTKNLLQCIDEVGGVKVLVWTGSTGVIDDGISNIDNAAEEAPIFPNHTDHYLRTKAQAESLVLFANRQHNLLTVALRTPALYGEGDSTTLPQIVANAQAGRGKVQVGDGQNQFDYLYLGNAAYAHRLAVKKLLEVDVRAASLKDDERVDGEVFVVTNDEVRPLSTCR